MSLVITEDYREKRMSLAAPFAGERVFHISSDGDGFDADQALLEMKDAIPINTPWSDQFQTLVSSQPVLKRSPGVQYHVVGIPYAQPPTGIFIDQTLDPLNRPTRFRWDQIDATVQSDVDLDGRPVLNPAGDKFDPMTIAFSYDRLTVWRTSPFFDVTQAGLLRNRCNSAAMTVLGYPVAIEHMCLRTMVPEEECTIDAKYVTIKYVFDIFFDSPEGPLGPYPFQSRYLSAGSQGWGTISGSSQRGRFCYANGNQIDGPIVLDLSGKPLLSTDSNVKILNANGTPAAPIANPTPSTYYHTQEIAGGSTEDGDDEGDAPDVGFALYFKATGVADLSVLKL